MPPKLTHLTPLLITPRFKFDLNLQNLKWKRMMCLLLFFFLFSVTTFLVITCLVFNIDCSQQQLYMDQSIKALLSLLKSAHVHIQHNAAGAILNLTRSREFCHCCGIFILLASCCKHRSYAEFSSFRFTSSFEYGDFKSEIKTWGSHGFVFHCCLQ